MRQIEASEVKPGMTIRFDMDGWRVEGTVSRVEPVTFGLEFYSTQSVEMTLSEDSPVTVLAEPARPETGPTTDDDMVKRAVEAHRETFNAWPVKRSLEDADKRRAVAMRAALNAALGAREEA